MKWTRSCLPELIRASPMTRKNRTIRQSAARNSYSRATRPMPPQRSRDVAKVSSSEPESLPAAISCSTGRNSSSRWKAIPSETQTNVEPMRLKRSGEAANLFAEFEPCTQWPYSSWTRRFRSSPGHGRDALRSSVVARKISREWSVKVSRANAAPGGLDLARRLRVVPEISEGARVGPGSTEAAPHPLEQSVRLVERSLGREARQVECLRVPSVRGEERLDLGPCPRVAELAFHDLQDFIEAVARELDERPHPRRGRSTRPLSARVEGLPAVRGQGAHVIRLHALFDHIPEEVLEQCLREAGRLSELETRAERGEQLPFDGARRRLLDSRDLCQEAADPPLGRDEQAPRAFVQAEDERLVRPEFLPELEHRALGLGPRRHHSAAVIADGQLRMCPMSKWSRRRWPAIVPDQCPSALVSGAADRSSDASAGTIGSPTRISPPTRI